MNTKLLRDIPLVACVAALSFATGCGSSNTRETAIELADGIPIELADGIRLEMVPIPNINLLFGKYEVTQAQWEAVMGENPSVFKGADYPVENVSWDDCQNFLRNLNAHLAVKKSGLMFRLPTEKEWEYACRAGATGDYCHLADGTEITEDTLGQVAWFEDNADGTTHPVGQKKPNAFGLYDMHGDVWEWTQTPNGTPGPNRGGGWYNSAWRCKSSHQQSISRDYRIKDLRLRLCAERNRSQTGDASSIEMNPTD